MESITPAKRHRSVIACHALTCLLLTGIVGSPRDSQALIVVSPQQIDLSSPEASQQLLVSQPQADGRVVDVTRSAEYSFANSETETAALSGGRSRHGNLVAASPHAVVIAGGLVRPVHDGQSELIIRVGNDEARVPIVVQHQTDPAPVSFRNEVVPILTKSRCNSGGCHGKAEGQNGFKLSIFGFDVESDYASLTKEGRGRRLLLTQPEHSLLLLKGTASMPHGGGRKLESDSYAYHRLLRWVREGAQFDNVESADATRIVGIEIEPTEQVLLAGGSQQLRVTAIDHQGHRHCVTVGAEYESNAASVADVDRTGLIQASDVPGQAGILVRYLGFVAVCRITSPRPGVSFERPAESNFIDGLVWNQLQKLGIPPSELCSDAEFLRRASLDTIGTLPSADEARAFLADTTADKRTRLVDELLARDEYADYWTMKWLDLLRADQLKVTPNGTVAMQRWLHRSFAQNRPFDAMARELLTVQGDIAREGPGAFYKAATQADEASRGISQLLLGVRIECAQCHHHPSERWSQADYVGLAGFFTGVKLKKLPEGGESIIAAGGSDLPHPRTGETVPAMPLGAEPAVFEAGGDRRAVLADWMTRPDNAFFAKAIANRMWAHYFGRGLVEPIDDIRDTNPATNEPLLQALTEHMRDVKFDLKAFTRTLLTSRVYQLSSRTTPANRDDHQNFSHAMYRTLPAEVLLDAVCQSTGVREKFNGWPDGYRAIQVWDNRIPSYFFKIFGRPVRATVCECERSGEPSITQALHLLNSPEIMAMIQARHGTARRLANGEVPGMSAADDKTAGGTADADRIIDELYLTTLNRFPVDAERTLMRQAFDSPDSTRRTAVEDILWALLNSKEFVFNH